MDKEFRGVISNWRLDNGRIHGTCVFHTTYENGIEKGQPIHTSKVESISTVNGARIAITLNSYYVLV